jgi:hypothetical protein
VYCQLDARPETVTVAIGNFADPSFPVPTYSVYEERRHAWISVPESAVGITSVEPVTRPR